MIKYNYKMCTAYAICRMLKRFQQKIYNKLVQTLNVKNAHDHIISHGEYCRFVKSYLALKRKMSETSLIQT